MSEHSRGPWHFDGDDTVSQGEALIAVVYNNIDANARLIAAAPDLLSACEDAEDLLLGYEATAAENELLRILAAAIAKASGA